MQSRLTVKILSVLSSSKFLARLRSLYPELWIAQLRDRKQIVRQGAFFPPPRRSTWPLGSDYLDRAIDVRACSWAKRQWIEEIQANLF